VEVAITDNDVASVTVSVPATNGVPVGVVIIAPLSENKKSAYRSNQVRIALSAVPQAAVTVTALVDACQATGSPVTLTFDSGIYDGAKLATSANSGYRWACEPDTATNAAVGVTVAAGCGFDLSSVSTAALRFPARYSAFVVGATYVFTLASKADSRSASGARRSESPERACCPPAAGCSSRWPRTAWRTSRSAALHACRLLWSCRRRLPSCSHTPGRGRRAPRLPAGWSRPLRAPRCRGVSPA